MKTAMRRMLDNAAKTEGYRDRREMLCDYSFMPTVFTPKHKTVEIIPLLVNSIINTKRSRK